MLCLVLLCFAQPETSLQFMKLESLGRNPLIETEKTIYKQQCATVLESTFKSAPVYLVEYENNKEKLTQVGNVSCIFRASDTKWLVAVAKLNKSVPPNYVLRAKFVATEADYNLDRVLEVRKCSITEFYLKPKDKATKFEDQMP